MFLSDSILSFKYVSFGRLLDYFMRDFVLVEFRFMEMEARSIFLLSGVLTAVISEFFKWDI